MSRVDLHMHTKVSGDGEFTPLQIIERAKRQNMEIIAITDHDSVSANEECIRLGKEAGIKVIPGVELGVTMDCGVPLHVTAYGIDYKDPRFIEREKTLRDWHISIGSTIIEKAKNIGFIFDDEKVYAKGNDGVITSEMVGEAILEDKRNDNDPRMDPYRKGHEKSDNPGFNFYKDFYCLGKPCYIERGEQNLTLKECSELIHSTGGIMCLAHPGHNIKHDLKLLEEIASYNLQGIEAYSSYHNQDDIDFFLQEAKRLNLIVTVGSDFHGKVKPAIEMGSIACDEEKIKEGLRKYNLI